MRKQAKGKSKGKSKSAKYYAKNPKAKAKKRAYQKEYEKKPSVIKKKVETITANRKAGTYGNGDGLDASHTKNGKIVMEKASKNRARNGAKKGKAKSAKRTNTKK